MHSTAQPDGWTRAPVVVRRTLSAPTAAIVIGGAAWILAAGGCRSYEPAPIETAQVHDAWLARTPADESARAFAERLARDEGRANADPFDPSDGLSIAEAEAVAMVFNRELRLARLEAGVSLAAAENAGIWEDPILGVDLERIVSGVPDPWTVGATVGITIPISGRLEAESRLADAEHAATLERLASLEWAARVALRELWVEWSAQLMRQRLGSDLAVRLREVLAIAERQAQGGVLTDLDARLFRFELVAAETALIGIEARAAELDLLIRDRMGLAPGAPVRLVECGPVPVRSTDLVTLRTQMQESNPELAAVRSEYEAAERLLRLELRKQYPDLTIGPGGGTDQGDDRVLLGISLPLPLWNRNSQGIATAEAGREAARGRVESVYEDLGSRLAVALRQYEAGRAIRMAVETRVLPLAVEQDADVRRAAELGGLDPLLLLQTLRSQHDTKLKLVEAVALESAGALRIEALLGPPQPRTGAVPVPVPTSTTGGAR